MSKFNQFLIPALVYLLIAFVFPTPPELTSQAWQVFAIFSCTITALITKPFEAGTVTLLSLAAVTCTGAIPVQKALEAFSAPLIWLILLISIMARGIMKVRLNERVAYWFVRKFGKSLTGISYSIVLTDVILAPFIPSTVAKAGGIMMPIFNSIAQFPEDEVQIRDLRNFLCLLYAQIMCITGAMFLTGTSGNPLIYNLALEQGVTLGWLNWAIAALLPACISLLAVPYLVLKLNPVHLNERLNFRLLAEEKLKNLGPVSRKELIVMASLLVVLLLWIIGPSYSIHGVSAALIGLTLLLLTNILTFEEVTAEKPAWNMFLWFSIVIMLAQNLQSLGVIHYFTNALRQVVPTHNWSISLSCITLVYFYSHYLFAGAVTHISSMYGVFVALGLTLGCPPVLTCLVLAFASGLFMSLTHYSAASTAILYANTSVSAARWCGVGLVVSILNIAIWASIGPVWWKLLGIY